MNYVVGVDLGGTQLRAVKIDREGVIHAYERTDTDADSGPEGVLTQMEHLINTVVGATSHAEIVGVGIGTPGPIDPFAGVVLGAPNLPGWLNVPIKAILSERTGLPVEVGNDANLAGLGEWRFGSGRGTEHFIYITISTGIGGGVIINRQLLLGRKGIAGEVGHITIQTDGPLCGCGNHGCWEAMASGTSLARFATEAVRSEMAHGRPSLITEYAGADPIEGWHVAAAAEQGDPLALSLMQREGELIGVGIVNLLHLFAPDVIALGGGVIKSMALLEPHMRRAINQRAMLPYRSTPIELAQLADKVGVIGAAALML